MTKTVQADAAETPAKAPTTTPGGSSGWRAAAPFYATMIAPLLAIAGLSGVLVQKDLAEIRRGEALTEQMATIEASAALTAALQRERGMSYGFVSSGGAAFTEKLPAQREQTDALIAAHRAALTSLGSERFRSPAAADRAEKVAAGLDALADWRAGVDALSVDRAELFKNYSATVETLISFGLEPLASGAAGDVSDRFVALENIKLAGEFAGRGRAFGAAVFGSDPSDEGAVARLISAQDLWARHEEAASHALAVSRQADRETLQKSLSGPEAQRVAELLDVMAAGQSRSDFGDVTAEVFFADATAYVNALSAATKAMMSEIKGEVQTRVSAAWIELGQIIGGGALMMLLVLGFGVRHASSLISAMRALRLSIQQIERQEAGIEVPAQTRRDELGAIARSLATITEQGAQTARVSAALTGSAAAVLIVDTGGEKVFENSAFAALRDKHGAAFDAFVDPAAPDCFTRLIDTLDSAEASGRVIQKSHGETAIELTAGGAIFEARRTPTLNRNDEVVGYAVELNDVTSVRGLEMEVTNVIEGVQRGELMHSVDSIDDQGFTSFVARGLNEQMDSINAFMGSLDSCLAAIAAGDLTAEMSESFDGDFEGARLAVNANLLRFREMFDAIRVATARVQEKAAPIAADARDLAERSEGQAAALEETSATMDSMSKTITANADSAGRARDLAAAATDRVDSGREVLCETTDAMSQIEQSAAKIAEIVNVIDSIAFQTNLLALNAAVEAARAGDAGKGFAVVASEVRTLAQRSAEAAQDIRGLITQSSENVSQGAALVSRTTEALAQINESIEALSGVVDNMSAASQEQATGVREINSTVAHLDEITQRNAAAAQHSADAAEQLSAEAEDLQQKVAFFKTQNDDAAAFEAA